MGHEKTGLGFGLLSIADPEGTLEHKRIEGSYEKALGALVIRFSLLTFLLEHFSREVFAISPKTADVLLSNIPLTLLIDKLRACTKHRMLRERDRKVFLDILKRAKEAAEQRNELLHALWIINQGEPVFCYRRRNKDQSEVPSIDRINKLNRSITSLTIELIEFTQRKTLSSPAVETVANALMEQKNKKP